MPGERSTCAGPARRLPGGTRRPYRAGYAYDPAQNLSRRTNNASGSTVTATVNALNQLTAGLGFSGSLAYDRRGNLLSIGSAGSGKAYAYDHENQCITAGWWNIYTKSDFVYDGKSRLRKRTDYSWNGSNWTPTGETRYVYDGILLVQERTSAGHPAVTYTRGLDLSGSLEGAGGIGGLLARTAHQSTSPYQPSTHAFYHADGNGNVTYLLNQARSHGASYRYDPYGRLIASSGGLAGGNLMRFSSKPWHDHSETYYYGYRFYLPEGQRCISRDPILEYGGVNLYAFVNNSPAVHFDALGLSGWGGMLWPTGDGSFINPADTSGRRYGGQCPPPMINGPISGLMHYLFGSGHPATISPGLAKALQDIQRAFSWPVTLEPENLTFGDYFWFLDVCSG